MPVEDPPGAGRYNASGGEGSAFTCQGQGRFEGGIELTYTFGSINNNIVNPRFDPANF
jgi:hypothetical protein